MPTARPCDSRAEEMFDLDAYLAIGDVGGQRRHFVDDHDEQRLRRGRRMQAGAPAEPVGSGVHDRNQVSE
jgi:hypothetical protein